MSLTSYRTLGRSGLVVSLWALGTMTFGTPGWGSDEAASRAYADLRTALEARGQPIGGNDMLIAAQALALGCVMVTANTDEFARVDGLKVENWLA